MVCASEAFSMRHLAGQGGFIDPAPPPEGPPPIGVPSSRGNEDDDPRKNIRGLIHHIDGGDYRGYDLD